MTAKLLPPAIQKQGERLASDREVETRRAKNLGQAGATRFPPLSGPIGFFWVKTIRHSCSSPVSASRSLTLPGELTPRPSFLLNDAITFGNLIVNNLDFQS
jgi:hypothetical protein